MLPKLALSLFIATVLSSSGQAAVIYDEAVNGNFSSDRFNPTPVSLSLGSNQIFGMNGSTDPRDYVTFTVPAGFVLSSITMLNTSPLGNLGFIGLEAGNQITLAPPNPGTAVGLLGWWHYAPGDIGSDILAKMSIPASGSSGFTLPLGNGTYSLWIQETSNPSPNASFRYGFDLNLALAPEPATWQTALIAFAGAGFWLARRRRRA
jgi:hypothetical protein